MTARPLVAASLQAVSPTHFSLADSLLQRIKQSTFSDRCAEERDSSIESIGDVAAPRLRDGLRQSGRLIPTSPIGTVEQVAEKLAKYGHSEERNETYVSFRATNNLHVADFYHKQVLRCAQNDRAKYFSSNL